MARHDVTITIGTSVFGADGHMIGTVDRINGDTVEVSGFPIPKRAFVRAGDNGLHLNATREALLSGEPAPDDATTTDTFVTEQDQMNRAVEDARRIDAPPPATGTLADPVAGSGFTRDRADRDNLLGDTTVSQPFEDLGDVGGNAGDARARPDTKENRHR